MKSAEQIQYSDKYYDDKFEYRWVAERIPPS